MSFPEKLKGVLSDPNFITGMSILAANADPRRNWSEGYADASRYLSGMQRSALARAEMEMRKQKFEQEQKAMEQQQTAAAALRERLAGAENPEDVGRALMELGQGGQVSTGAQLYGQATRGAQQLKEIRMFEHYNQLPEGPQKEAFGQMIGLGKDSSVPNQTEFERLLPEYQRLASMRERSPEQEARYQAIASNFGLIDPAQERKDAISAQEEAQNIDFNKRMFEQNLREMGRAKDKLIRKTKEFGASGLSRRLTLGVTESAGEFDALIDEFTGEIALQTLKDLKLTGATLGQITEKELAMLKADLGGINERSGSDFIQEQVNEAFANFRTRVINRLNGLEQQEASIGRQPLGVEQPEEFGGFRIIP